MMEKRITLRMSQELYNDLAREAQDVGMTISDIIRDRSKHSADIKELTEEVRKLREALEYIIDKDKRQEYAESRVI